MSLELRFEGSAGVNQAGSGGEKRHRQRTRLSQREPGTIGELQGLMGDSREQKQCWGLALCSAGWGRQSLPTEAPGFFSEPPTPALGPAALPPFLSLGWKASAIMHSSALRMERSGGRGGRDLQLLLSDLGLELKASGSQPSNRKKKKKKKTFEGSFFKKHATDMHSKESR